MKVPDSTTISIITVNYNNVAGLESTLKSVFSQTYSNIEYLVIDGGSTDASLNLIRKNADNIAYWVSEKDKGIYDAMNKGISVAKGKYLMFLNSGDILVDKFCLEACFNCIINFPSVDIFYGDIFYINSLNLSNPKRLYTHPVKLSLPYLKETTINHQASFIKSSLFKEFGLYPAKYKLAADYWLFLNALLNGKKYKHVGLTLINYDTGGVSSTSRDLYTSEKQTVWEEIVPQPIKELVDENQWYKHLIGYKIVDAAIKINEKFQKLRGK